ncbi:MAG: hypothetical protein WCT12_23905 [Verrucomicrobiota bacterium]
MTSRKRGFPICKHHGASTVSRLKVGDTAGWKTCATPAYLCHLCQALVVESGQPAHVVEGSVEIDDYGGHAA